MTPLTEWAIQSLRRAPAGAGYIIGSLLGYALLASIVIVIWSFTK